jgi:integrase
MVVKEAQDTKNGKHTRIKGSPKLEKLLARAYTLGSPYVFPSIRGGPFHYQNFQRRWWRPIVSRLAKEGAIGLYLSEYHARHTWISAALDHGYRPADVAYLARTDVGIIYKHYLGRSRDLDFPDI